ncbi:MAG: ABC transporter transmembrane domain-containing protein [Caulobacter sp.]|nr:ABC transporter transmembrane domain-containing protein [Caulobacter sp.]
MADAAPKLTSRQLAARIAKTYLRPRWKGVVTALVCALVVAVTAAIFTRIIASGIQDLLVEHRPGAMWTVPAIVVACALARVIAQVVQSAMVNSIGHGIVGDIQVELFARMVRADLARLRATHSGAFVSQVLYDAGLMREATTTGVINYAQGSMLVLGQLVVMFTADWQLSLAVLLIAPFASRLMRRFSRRSRKAAKGAMAATGTLSSLLMEGLDGVRVVKMENSEAREEARVAAAVAERQRHIIKGANARAQSAPTTELIGYLILALVLVYAGWRGSRGEMNAESFTAFAFGLVTAANALRQMANTQTVFAEGLTAARRLFGALDVKPEVAEDADAQPLVATGGHIRFDNVSFHYGAGAPALDGVTLEAGRGETIALVGPSGGGKSTILSLLPRFYDVSGGALTIDGQDVRRVTTASLRSQIALVTQEPFLFDDTIRNNIAYARPDASQEEVEQAARLAAAHDFILGQPHGYDTLVGENAARLSGGQRQRIAIARAFLKDAPILLLDEATSALDTESEAQVQAALERLMNGRTTILIAHRLSTVKNADRIYVIDKGRVVETGAHAGLVKKNGLYARLAQAQNLDSTVVDLSAPPAGSAA